jgi:hypothetical protein
LTLGREQRIQYKRKMTLQDAKLEQILRRHDHKRADGVESLGTQHLVVLLALQGQMQV